MPLVPSRFSRPEHFFFSSRAGKYYVAKMKITVESSIWHSVFFQKAGPWLAQRHRSLGSTHSLNEREKTKETGICSRTARRAALAGLVNELRKASRMVPELLSWSPHGWRCPATAVGAVQGAGDRGSQEQSGTGGGGRTWPSVLGMLRLRGLGDISKELLGRWLDFRCSGSGAIRLEELHTETI